jgi:hypothetical protein
VVRKMNKLTGILILLMIILIPGMLFSKKSSIDDLLYSTGENLGSKYVKLDEISQDLIAITQTCNCGVKEYHNINYYLLHIIYTNTIIVYESEQLKSSKIIESIYKPQYYQRKKRSPTHQRSSLEGF